MVEVEGKWILVHGIACAVIAAVSTMALLDSWPTSPIAVVLIGIGLLFVWAWILCLTVMWVRNRRLQQLSDGEADPS
ncbi:MAG: hypothetical protein ACRDM2_04355 [Gaiellaceae bacterium]